MDFVDWLISFLRESWEWWFNLTAISAFSLHFSWVSYTSSLPSDGYKLCKRKYIFFTFSESLLELLYCSFICTFHCILKGTLNPSWIYRFYLIHKHLNVYEIYLLKYLYYCFYFFNIIYQYLFTKTIFIFPLFNHYHFKLQSFWI